MLLDYFYVSNYNGTYTNVLKFTFQFGLSDQDLADHFAGPAFLPWQRMGNMESFGGPLPPSWHQFTRSLQHQILERMRNLGMTPVLPAFAGHVPKALVQKYPQVNVTKQSWNHFPPTYLLDANERHSV